MIESHSAGVFDSAGVFENSKIFMEAERWENPVPQTRGLARNPAAEPKSHICLSKAEGRHCSGSILTSLWKF